MKTGCVRSHENSDGMKSAVESKRTGLVLREREGRTEATGVCVGGKGGGAGGGVNLTGWLYRDGPTRVRSKQPPESR